MIRVAPVREPDDFDVRVRQPGVKWLEKYANEDPERPRAYWNRKNCDCRAALEAMFHHRCGWTACWIPSGEVEHFISWKTCKARDERHRAYEWDNFRWIMPQLNGRKGVREVLDPFEVEDDWFEVNLFTLHLRLTDKVPAAKRRIAEDTLEFVGIGRDPIVIGARQEALTRFAGGATLRDIYRYSPIMGRALERLMNAPLDALSAPEQRLRHKLKARREAARQREAQP